MTKTVYSYAPVTGEFLGSIKLDDSDLSPLEPGIYLIPGCCLEDEPPQPMPGTWPYAVGGAWELRDLPKDPGPEPQPEPTLEQRRARLKARVTEKRWEVETGGLTLPSGMRVLTAASDQNRIAATIAAMEAIGLQSIDFKASSDWITLTLAQLSAIRRAIGLHVQACFTAERMHHEALDALDPADLDSYDINTGWPSAAANLLEN